MNHFTTFYDKKGLTLLFKEIDGILPIVLEDDMRITIDEAEVRVSRWEYHLNTTEQRLELRIFLRGRWAAPSMTPLIVEPQVP